MTGMATGALGINCGQGSWQQWWLPALTLYQAYVSSHLLLLSRSSTLPQYWDNHHQLLNLSPAMLHFLLFLLSPFHSWPAPARAGFGGRGCVTACKQVPASQLSTFLCNTEQCEYQQYYTGCGIFMPGKLWIKATNHFRKKKKRCLKCQYICKILVPVETFKWILNAQLSMACSLQGIILCWMSSPFSSWPSLNFRFLSRYVSCIYQKWIEIQDFAILLICMLFLYKAWKYFSSGIYSFCCAVYPIRLFCCIQKWEQFHLPRIQLHFSSVSFPSGSLFGDDMQ